MLAKIKKELMKSGFPLELKCAAAFEENGWGVDHNFIFEDLDSKQHRELDIFACDVPAIFDDKSCLTIYVFAECKKSDKPWVFFPASEGMETGRRVLAYASMFRYGGGKWARDEYNSLLHRLADVSHYSNAVLSSWYTEVFVRDSSGHDILDAISKIVKANKYVNEDTDDASSKLEPPLLFVSYNTIIFDGALLEAKYEKGNLHVKERENLVLSVNYGSPSVKGHFLIDIIRADCVGSYLRQLGLEKTSFLREAKSFYNELKA